MNRTIITLSVLAVFLVSCVREAPSTNEGLRQLVVRFAELKSAGKLPDLSPDEKGNLSTYAITDQMKNSKWFRPFVEQVNNCLSMYAIDVHSKDKHLMLFFCGDTKPMELIGVYSERNDIWILETPKHDHLQKVAPSVKSVAE